MNFQDAEKTYRDLAAQHAAGKLTDADFEAEVAKLRLQDSQGRWWQIGVQTGDWYMHDGQKWNKARPPATPPPPPTGAVSAPPEAGAATPKPASALPARLFSAAPAGRSSGGLPPAVLIVIVAVVALVGVGLLVGAYLFISGQAGGSAATHATTTPTLSVALAPSTAVPTITLEVPTDTPEAPPTLVVSATEVLTPTRTPAPARPTATRKAVSPTPAGPTATKTPNVPPGLYVTGMEIDPAKPNIGDTLQFTVDFLNTTGAVQTYTWIVKVFQCPEQCDTFKTSFGETTRKQDNVATGAAKLVSDRHITIGQGRCDYVAMPFYIDQSNQQVVPFMTTNNGLPLYQHFTVCH